MTKSNACREHAHDECSWDQCSCECHSAKPEVRVLKAITPMSVGTTNSAQEEFFQKLLDGKVTLQPYLTEAGPAYSVEVAP